MKPFAFVCLVVLLFAPTIPAGAQDGKPGLALSAADRAYIIHNTFVLSHTIASIPESVKQTFSRPGSGRSLLMAELGQPFDATDVITGLPSRRLVFCGVSKNLCVLHYECGGYAYHTNIDVFHLDANNAILVYSGSSLHVYQNMTDLRWNMWAHHQFGATPYFD